MPDTIILKTRSGQGHNDPKMVHHISPSKDASIHQIGDSYLKEYRKYAPDLMPILEIRSEVKVTVTQKRYTTYHTKDIEDMHQGYRKYAPDSMPILETRSEVKVTVTGTWDGTFLHPKMHSHTKFGIPTSNNIRDMLRT